ncbi:hypothetical protein LuPra_01183 [Luteitalea pratensis]|uniref:DUF5666 domain-containing protein n=1 Tax=Luteitalea pratensis TaxID=1855912 RepID=A0A143PHI6_LUTPR|nr:DUF5666 domain-containing protein [Luteitalea pratensis]AMY07995.1 hypothetical protein LuPra_01183 [Luteitalea pratensis]
MKAGDRIDIKVRVTDTSVRIEAEHRDRSNDDDDKDDSELKGTVSSLTGTCPTLTFTMNGTNVKTSNATKFGLACDRVANGTRLEVEGTRQGGWNDPGHQARSR